MNARHGRSKGRPGLLAAVVVAAAIGFTPSVASAAAPGNDQFANAYELVGAGNTRVATNVDATLELFEPAHAGATSATKTVWWKWTTFRPGLLYVSLAGSNFDTVLGIYKPDYPGAPVKEIEEVASNDDSGDGLTSAVERVRVESGQTYYIAVAGYGGTSGTINLAQNFVMDPARLRVTTNPSVGAVIKVDGIERDTWSLNWLPVSEGNHLICGSAMQGFYGQGCFNVTTIGGQTTTAEVPYFRKGYLRVLTSPALPSTITVDGSPRNDWGMWAGISPDTYTVCFGAVKGYNTPACRNVVVTAGGTTTTTGTFTPNAAAPGPAAGFGYLRVTTTPPTGALLSIIPSGTTADGGDFANDWGIEWVKLAPGNYNVCVGEADNTRKPVDDCPSQTVTAGATRTANFNFAPKGFLRVLTSPAVGGTVIVDGAPANVNGVWTPKDPGTYDVCFGAVFGYVTPPCQNDVVVTASNTSTVTGNYVLD